MAEAAHLNICKDRLGNYYVEVVQGADRIVMTPPMWNLTEAHEAIRRINAASGCPIGRLD